MPCNLDPLELHTYMVKLGFTINGLPVHNFSYFCPKTHIVGSR